MKNKKIMKNKTTMMDLPEECLANVISLTSPRDACRLSSLSKTMKSAAESDVVWDKFLPSDVHTIIHISSINPPPQSKKELYMALSEKPVLIDNETMSFSLKKWSGKKNYMISARRLRFAWDNTPQCWTWKSIPEAESMFKVAARVCGRLWLEIRGRIKTRMLSPSTIYKAYLVYKITGLPYGLLRPVVVTVGTKACGFDYESPSLKETMEESDSKHTVILLTRKELEQMGRFGRRVMKEAMFPFPGESRKDGWVEMELGEFLCRGEEEEELEMICCEVERREWRSGLLVQGIEVRPVS